jgi:superfamily II RNA helicase
MVYICGKKYNKEFKEDIFPFELSCFQKYAIEGIKEDKHVLLCVPTGNGKTLPAEFAIQYFVKKGKKVIYTSPIKALSNQKYYDFKEKYPNITFGLLTGDIKLNPNADVLIMTAEILQNALYKTFSLDFDSTERLSKNAMFEMDFENELACVIHDEVHSICLSDRGHVWESIFMLLPPHVQNVMLSATLDVPEYFAKWCEDINSNKEVYLITFNERAVPLNHYSFITCNEGFFKKIKDKDLEKEIKEVINKPILLKEKNDFQEINYRKITKTLKLFSQKDPTTRIKRSYVLNQLCKYLVENKMLPCACFILSRKQIEIAAKEITYVLLEDDSKTPYIIRNKCENILREKMSNYKEFIELPDYISLISLLEKGIATHHSGMIPVLKELVELLFVQGFIKMLFCTETFSCGLNMPIKTTIFTDLHKFDGKDFRMLYGYEYNQASGRAGRRGLDTQGYVIHLNNLFKGDIDFNEYKIMMFGKPQKLISNYKITYHLLLSSFHDIVKKSLFQKEIDCELSLQEEEIRVKKVELERIENSLQHLKTSLDDLSKYIEYNNCIKQLTNKKKKDMERKITDIKERNKNIGSDLIIYQKFLDLKEEIKCNHDYYSKTKNYLQEKINKTFNLLKREKFLEDDNITTKGIIAKEFKEVPCILFSHLIVNGYINDLTTNEIGIVLSCFTNIHIVSEDKKCIKRPEIPKLERIMDTIDYECNRLQTYENENHIETGEVYDIQYDLMEYINGWLNAETLEECKYFLQVLREEKSIYLGEFVKAMLKIIAICNEITIVCELMYNYDLLKKIKFLIVQIQKFVVTNQSLYI